MQAAIAKSARLGSLLLLPPSHFSRVPTLCDPIDGSPSGSPVPRILQERTLEWVAISFSNAWKWKVKVKSFSRARLLATPWTAAYQAPPSMGFSRQEYWSGVPLPSLRLGSLNSTYLILTALGAGGFKTKVSADLKCLVRACWLAHRGLSSRCLI